MRKACNTLTQLALALALFATCAAMARAQARDSRLVSARAGAVNLTSGDVTVRRAGQKSWQTLLRTDDLRDGDAVRTGSDGRAEILLNPGSYLRLGEDTEFEMTDTSLNTLRLKVARGSALIEASIPEGGSSQAVMPEPPTKTTTVIEAAARYTDAFVILIDTPKTQALIVRSGVYRINVAADGSTELFVRSGRALVGRDAVTVKEGKVATVARDGAVEVAKFDGKQKDELDLWGKKRAQEIARVNSQLPVRALNTAFANMGWDSFSWGYNPSGLWYWDARASYYTYIPFVGCRSPYGYWYNTAAPGLIRYCECFRGYDTRYIIRHNNGGGTTGWPNNGGTTVTSGGGGTTGGGTTTNGGSTFGGVGGGNTVSRPAPEVSPITTTQHSGGGSVHKVDPPL